MMNADEIMQIQSRMAGKRTPGPKRRRSALVETGVMLDLQEREALDAVAGSLGKSRSALIREAVQRVWLKKERKQ